MVLEPTVASTYSRSAAAKAGYTEGVRKQKKKKKDFHNKDMEMAEGRDHNGKQLLGTERVA